MEQGKLDALRVEVLRRVENNPFAFTFSDEKGVLIIEKGKATFHVLTSEGLPLDEIQRMQDAGIALMQFTEFNPTNN